MQDIRLIGLDLDGTVFDDAKHISPRNLAAIEAAVQAGIIVLPATGRTATGVPQAFTGIPGVHYALISNGASVVDMRTGEHIVDQPFSLEDSLRVYDVLKPFGGVFSLFVGGKSYATKADNDLIDVLVPENMRDYFRKTRIEVPDLRSVTVAEIMGRHTGWLAAASSLAAGPDCNGPDLILLPERPFDEDAFLARVAELEKERHNVIIAASEGVKNKDGVFLCDLVSTAGQLDAFGHKAILSGTSRYLADLIRVRLGCKTRAIEFSTLQRCASHLASRTDVTEAYQVGGAAVEAAVRGETAKMSAIKRLSDQPYRIETEMVDVTQVANFEKKVPDEWITADGMHVNANFERYARPLIQAELTPIYINGVPRHIHLD